MRKLQARERAVRSGRVAGAVGRDPVCYRAIRSLADAHRPGQILDFGAGREARHTLALRAKGYDITAHEVPENRTEIHDTRALRRKYEVVIMSNVINVQGSESMLRETMDAACAVVRHKGYLVVNFPASPRYLPRLTFKSVECRLRRRGFSRASLEDGVLIMQKGANR